MEKIRKKLKKIKGETFVRLGLGVYYIINGYYLVTEAGSRSDLISTAYWPARIINLVSGFESEFLVLWLGILSLFLGLSFCLWFLPSKAVRYLGLIVFIQFAWLFYWQWPTIQALNITLALMGLSVFWYYWRRLN
jgi:hypothetical protein